MNLREVRRNRMKERVVAAAWELAAEQGLGGITLRALAARVELTQPALYTYFASKDDLYDDMYADGFRLLLDEMRSASEARAAADPLRSLREGWHVFIEWCRTHPHHFQLMFLRTLPTFAPTPSSYELADDFVRFEAEEMAKIGIADEDAVEIFGTMLLGLVTTQLANDPQGDRWSGLADRAAGLLWSGFTTEKQSR